MDKSDAKKSKKQTRKSIERNEEQQPTKEDNTNTGIAEVTISRKPCKEENMSTLLDVGSYVTVKYEDELYPAKILSKEKNE